MDFYSQKSSGLARAKNTQAVAWFSHLLVMSWQKNHPNQERWHKRPSEHWKPFSIVQIVVGLRARMHSAMKRYSLLADRNGSKFKLDRYFGGNPFGKRLDLNGGGPWFLFDILILRARDDVPQGTPKCTQTHFGSVIHCITSFCDFGSSRSNLITFALGFVTWWSTPKLEGIHVLMHAVRPAVPQKSSTEYRSVDELPTPNTTWLIGILISPLLKQLIPDITGWILVSISSPE